MKRLFIIAAAAACLQSGCTHKPARNQPVKETYIHKYGLCVTKEEWESHGRSGVIVNHLKDGSVVSKNYRRGELDGDTTYTFPNSDIIARKEVYKEGKLVAESENFPSGTPRALCHIGSEGRREIERWFEDGTPRCHEIFDGDELLSAEYFSPQNLVESRIQNGEGLRVTRDQYGQRQSEDLFQDGHIVMRRTFHPSGDPKEEIPIANGQIHGTRKTYLVGGIPNTVEEWRDGRQEGRTITFHNGEKRSEVQYRQGQKHGLEVRFGRGGQIAEQLQWVAGKEHGPHRYLLEGEQKIDWYHKGQIVSKTTFEKLNYS